MGVDVQYVGWICSYVPEELIHAAGLRPYRISPEYSSNSGNCRSLPANFCPLVKKIVESFEKGEYEFLSGYVIANSCNAMSHLYNVLVNQSHRDQFVYFLDVPRKNDDLSVKYFENQLMDLFVYLNNTTKPSIESNIRENQLLYSENTDSLLDSIKVYRETQEKLAKINYGIHNLEMDFLNLTNKLAREPREQINTWLDHKINDKNIQNYNKNKSLLILTGAMINQDLAKILQNVSNYHILPETCQGLKYLQKDGLLSKTLDKLNQSGEQELLELIAFTYLNKPPCTRLLGEASNASRKTRIYELKKLFDYHDVKGVIHHDLGFCDISNYDFLMINDICDDYDIPLLRLNSELGKTELGQLQTRLEAFCEMKVL